MITECPITSSEGDASDPDCTGVDATIIDFGLSRLDSHGGRVICTEIPEEVFDGVGDQWDVYRAEQDEVKGDWEAYHPITNVMVSLQSLRFFRRLLIHTVVTIYHTLPPSFEGSA